MKLGMVSWLAPTCCSYLFGQIGTSFSISFLQTGASLKKARGSERERATFECETIYVVSLEFIYKGNMSAQLNFGIIPASFGLIYTLIVFFVI